MSLYVQLQKAKAQVKGGVESKGLTPYFLREVGLSVSRVRQIVA